MNCANHPDRERKAFCQNCGKPLCAECARTVGQAVFCEPCLELRLAAANAAAAGFSQSPGSSSATGSAGYEAVGGGSAYTYPGATEGVPFGARPATPPPGAPSPGIAFLLGFVPGVGAMYNGQYAKGVVHLIVFAVLVSLADQNGIFGLFVAFWVFYQAFEAYHTARARRDGTAMPNFFGLNDVGERFGFGKTWPGPAAGGAVPPAGPASTTSYQAPPTSYAPPANASYAPPYNAPDPRYGSPYTPPVDPGTPWGAPVENFGSPVPPVPSPASRFPIGAIVLIALGVLFLLGSTRMFVTLPLHFLLPFLLIGVGVYIFVRRMTSTGVGWMDDGSLGYRLRLVRALQSSVWVVLVGILFLLDALHILSWGRSWPLFIIVGGVMAFVQRSAYTAAAQQTPFPGYGYAPPAQTPPEPTDPGTSVVPRDREGS